MFGVINPVEYIIGAIIIVLLPGPNSMYCLSVSGQYGIRSGYRSAAGVLLGDTILMLTTIFGAGAALKAYPSLFNSLKLFGGIYLLWLGGNLIVSAWQKFHHQQYNRIQKTLKPTHVFKRALTLSLSNPKAILFFLAFFVQFVSPNYPQPLLSFLILTIIFQIISFSYLNLLIFTGVSLRRFFAEQHLLACTGMAGMGILFCSFALKLWTATL